MWGIWKPSVQPSQFFCKSKTARKKLTLLFKEAWSFKKNKTKKLSEKSPFYPWSSAQFSSPPNRHASFQEGSSEAAWFCVKSLAPTTGITGPQSWSLLVSSCVTLQFLTLSVPCALKAKILIKLLGVLNVLMYLISIL